VLLLASQARAVEPVACAAEAQGRFDRKWKLRLVAGPGVPADELRAAVREAGLLFSSYGLELDAAPKVSTTPLSSVMGGRSESLRKSLEQAALPVSGHLTPAQQEQARRLVAREALGPLGEFVSELARPAGEGVIVVLLPSLVASGSVAEQMFVSLDALTLSPALLADPESRELREALSVVLGNEPFSPVVFLSRGALARSPDTLAHELGHLLGLSHRDGPENLMSVQRRSGCRPVLDAQQFARARQTLP
jgi:hypothetical protein